MRKLVILSFIVIVYSAYVSASVSLPMIFSDNMVLQRNMKVPVWGHAAPGESISAELGGHTASVVTGKDGRWKLYLGPLDAGGPFDLKVRGQNEIVVKNVLVGEVWICSGQSNMALEVKSSMNARQEIASAAYPEIRYFQVINYKAPKPLDDVSPTTNPDLAWLNHWQLCSPETVGRLTAVGYFFGRRLYENLDVPVGLISVSWGGTTAEAWTPQDALAGDPEMKDILTDWPGYNNDEEWLKSEYAKYLKGVEEASKKKEEPPLYFNQPSVLYNGIIAPVIPFGIRGVIWYQGESNAYRAYQYRHLFPLMISSWREKWGQGDFPFLFVQLAGYHFEPQVFPELREAQNMALSLPNTAMAVAIDVGDSANIHPKNKQEVGRRLALAAENIVYHEDRIFSGPAFQNMVIKDGKCYLTFNNTGDGMTAKDSRELKGFTVAGTDRAFAPAQAEIQGDKIVVWSDHVASPVAVRYAWANYPGAANLYNRFGDDDYLPASPFRTDDWPGLTYDRTRKKEEMH